MKMMSKIVIIVDFIRGEEHLNLGERVLSIDCAKRERERENEKYIYYITNINI